MNRTTARSTALALGLALIAAHTALAEAPSKQVTRNDLKQFVGREGSWQDKFQFSEAVTVNAPKRLIFLAGVGPEEEGTVEAFRAPGDVVAQCAFAWQKIEALLAKQGATLRDIVKITTYTTDARFRNELGDCRRRVLGPERPYPIHTFIVVPALAHPAMLLEIEVIAALP